MSNIIRIEKRTDNYSYVEEDKMFRILSEEKIISTIILLTIVLSMVSKIMMSILYQNMIKEADNMSTTNHKILKQCKLKFANCYQLNQGVANIPVFVDKFLNKLSIGPLTLQTIYHLSGQLMLLSVFFAGVGVCKSIIIGRTLGEILPFYIISFFGLYLYFSVSSIADVKGKKRILKICLVDYLENHMVNKLGKTERDLEIVAPKNGGRSVDVMAINSFDKRSKEATEFTKADEKELEELLKEFLTS